MIVDTISGCPTNGFRFERWALVYVQGFNSDFNEVLKCRAGYSLGIGVIMDVHVVAFSAKAPAISGAAPSPATTP